MCVSLAPFEAFGERLSFCSDRNRPKLRQVANHQALGWTGVWLFLWGIIGITTSQLPKLKCHGRHCLIWYSHIIIFTEMMQNAQKKYRQNGQSIFQKTSQYMESSAQNLKDLAWLRNGFGFWLPSGVYCPCCRERGVWKLWQDLLAPYWRESSMCPGTDSKGDIGLASRKVGTTWCMRCWMVDPLDGWWRWWRRMALGCWLWGSRKRWSQASISGNSDLFGHR